MAKVRLLDSGTVNKIAAGEVVERPASCVKELVENSIDAGATRIEVEIQGGGKNYIRVTDNGIGMNNEDANLSICRHATSKIKNANDLTNIETLGFRGEALPTITSVSKFSMSTRQEESELGIQIKLEGGLKKDVNEIGCPLGTTIKVEELFFNTPARKKFLKTTNTEAAKIHDYIVKLSLSRPSISFKMINGSRTVLRTPGTGKLFDAITSVYGSEMAESLLKIDLKDVTSDKLTIKGYVSKPNILKSYRSWQTFIVNGRIINSRIISRAVDEAYKAMIPKSGYPFVVLVIEIDPFEVDVNVHPQKIEVRFADEGKIYQSVYASIKQAIEDKNFTNAHEIEELQDVAVKPDYLKWQTPLTNFSNTSSDYFNTRSNIVNNDDYDFINVAQTMNQRHYEPVESTYTSANTYVQDNAKSKEFVANENILATKIVPIGQVNLCYIVAANDDGMYIIDQHAAHERILFDRLTENTSGIPAQQLLVHQIVRFDEQESQIIENNLDLFHKLGFTMEPSGSNEYRLKEIPVDIVDVDAESLLREIMTSLPPIENAANIDSESIAKNIRQACLAMTACKAAIKAGQELNMRQMQVILDQLSKTKHPFTCPHGRPTILKFSNQDLEKMFHRT